jgi:hypothetical protein
MCLFRGETKKRFSHGRSRLCDSGPVRFDMAALVMPRELLIAPTPMDLDGSAPAQVLHPLPMPDCRCRPAALAYLPKQRLTRTGMIYAIQEAGHDRKDNIFRRGEHVGKMTADELWHRRLMHTSYDKLKRASTMNLKQSQMRPTSSG